MMKGFTAATCMLFASLSPALAGETMKLGPDSFDAVQVRAFDGATGGCWTNIGEVIEYAEDHLRLEGYNVVEQTDGPPATGEGMLFIDVMSKRTPAGYCYGYWTFEMHTNLLVPDRVTNGQGSGWVMTGRIGPSHPRVFSNQRGNINRWMLDSVKEYVQGWPFNKESG